MCLKNTTQTFFLESDRRIEKWKIVKKWGRRGWILVMENRRDMSESGSDSGVNKGRKNFIEGHPT